MLPDEPPTRVTRWARKETALRSNCLVHTGAGYSPMGSYRNSLHLSGNYDRLLLGVVETECVAALPSSPVKCWPRNARLTWN